MIRLLALALGVPFSLAVGQTTSTTNGWSQQGSLREADAIVAGDIVEGTAADDGSSVRVSAVLQVLRVVRGSVVPQSRLRLAFTYVPSPVDGPDVTRVVPRGRALWLLEDAGNETWQPLPVATLPRSLGGRLLPLPPGDLPPSWFYPADAPPERKLACELASALEVLAPKTGPAQMLFHEVSGLLLAIDGDAPVAVLRRLLESPAPALRAVALAGVLRRGDLDAVFLLERDLANLAPTVEAREISNSLGMLQLDQNTAAIHSLGRAALAETELPGLEGQAASRLGWSKSLEALPYLAVMLESPDSFARAQAAMGLCTLLRPMERLWKADMAPHCPDHAPLRPDEEAAILPYWKQWWVAERASLRDVSLAVVHPPARYHAAPATAANGGATEVFDVPVEQRFRSLVSMVASFQRDSGAKPFRKTLINSLDENDDEKLLRILLAVDRRLDEQRAADMRFVNAARLAGKPPDVGEMRKGAAAMDRILREGLEEARRDLSPAGWDAVQSHMKSMNIVGVRLTAPPPR